jgi:hypothetical protein
VAELMLLVAELVLFVDDIGSHIMLLQTNTAYVTRVDPITYVSGPHCTLTITNMKCVTPLKANLSFPSRSKWDHDANDADLCCESWGGASPEKGGPNMSYVLWGADGQGSSGWKSGPEGFAAMGTANMTLEKLLQSYF